MVAKEVLIVSRGVRYGENLLLLLFAVQTQVRTLDSMYLPAAYFPKFQTCTFKERFTSSSSLCIKVTESHYDTRATIQ